MSLLSGALLGLACPLPGYVGEWKRSLSRVLRPDETFRLPLPREACAAPSGVGRSHGAVGMPACPNAL